jgi:hypothetical protein
MRADNAGKVSPAVFRTIENFGDIILSLDTKNSDNDFRVISIIKECLDFITGQTDLYPTMESVKFTILYSGFTKTALPVVEFYIFLSCILNNNPNDLKNEKNIITLMKYLHTYDKTMNLKRQLDFFDRFNEKEQAECS